MYEGKIKFFGLVFLIFLILNCATTHGPIVSKRQFSDSVDLTDATATISVVLQDYGYTILVANERIGTVTTDWKQEEKRIVLWGGHLWRTRISVTISSQTNDITMKISKQKYDDDKKLWKEENPGEKDEETLNTILDDIELKLSGL